MDSNMYFLEEHLVWWIMDVTVASSYGRIFSRKLVALVLF